MMRRLRRRRAVATVPPQPPSQNSLSRRLPHFWLFVIVNVNYCGPVLIAYYLAFSEGGVGQVLNIGPTEITRFAAVYVLSVLSFWAGAAFVRGLPLHAVDKRLNAAPYAQFRNGSPMGLRAMTVIISVALVACKIALIPSGVYSQYIFDGDLVAGPIWTASMFLSEALVIFLVGHLISEKTLASPYFIGGVLCLSINLLHGTRIFDVALALCVVVYFWIQVGFNRRVLAYTGIGIAALFAVLYLAFATRTDYHYSDDAGTLTMLASPVAYEAVFSQMSLLGFLQGDQVTVFGHPLDFISDTISWVLPRFLNPDKDSAGLLGQYADLAPVGAFSGHASGLIYFGYSLGIYYFLVGAFGSWLQRKAKTNPISFIIYLYFCADILFRMMRDSLIYPIKYFLNDAILLIVGIYLFEHLKAFLSRRRAEFETASPELKKS